VGSSTANRATGQWIDDPDGLHWWFDSGSIALDFAHPGLATLDDAVQLAHWLEQRFDNSDGAVSERDVADARALSASIRDAAARASRHEPLDAATVDVLNLFAATPDIPPALAGGTRQAGRSRVRTGQALSAIARAAVELFSHDEGRIRECASDVCDIVFFDDSRSNNRRWCSMQRCGNRAKVRTFRAAH
jgi:predicted RNA-binding Zn ribbon-like protein